MYCVHHHSQGQFWFVSEESSEIKSCAAAVLDARCSWPVIAWDGGERGDALSAIWHYRFTFQRSSRSSVWLPLRENIVTSEANDVEVSHMQHRLVIVLFVLVCQLPRKISADISLLFLMLYTNSWQDLKKGLGMCVILPSTVVLNHVLLNYRNLCICATCVHVFDAAVPPVVK